MKYVKLINNIVVEILPESTYEKGINYWYGEEFAKSCIEAPDDVSCYMIYNEDGTFNLPIVDNESTPIIII